MAKQNNPNTLKSFHTSHK